MKASINKKTENQYDYDLKYNWPNETVFLPVVFNPEYRSIDDSKLIYSFNIYLSKPETCFEVEGKDFEACEDEAWRIYQHYLNCSDHFFEAYESEHGYNFACSKCGYFQLADVLLSGLKELYSL